MLETRSKNINCLKCIFSCVCYSNEAPESEQIVSRRFKLRRGASVCSPKQIFRSLYAVRSGVLKAYHLESEGRENIENFYFSGEIIGFEAIYTGKYSFSVEALTDTVICEIPYDNLLAFSSRYPNMQREIMHLSSWRINLGSYLQLASAEQKLAHFLVDIMNRLHLLDLTLNLPMSRQDIANYLGLAPETVSRILHRWDDEKILISKNKKLILSNLAKIKQIASGLTESSSFMT